MQRLALAAISEIRRAIRRLGARGLNGQRDMLRVRAVACLRHPDAVLLAIYQASLEEPDVTASDLHAALVVNGISCTYDNVRILRMALGFRAGSRGKKAEQMAVASKQAREVSPVAIVNAMPGRLRAQLDQLPETEQRKVLAGWAR